VSNLATDRPQPPEFSSTAVAYDPKVLVTNTRRRCCPVGFGAPARFASSRAAPVLITESQRCSLMRTRVPSGSTTFRRADASLFRWRRNGLALSQSAQEEVRGGDADQSQWGTGLRFATPEWQAKGCAEGCPPVGATPE
jgi:hypothetical protein